MSEKKNYPYIGKSCTGNTVLFHSKDSGSVVKSRPWIIDSYKTFWAERENFKDVTREHLKNTWGKVESEEHRAMICELAVNGGYKLNCSDYSAKNGNCFYFGGPFFAFGYEEMCSKEAKQIILPMPPADPLKELKDLRDENNWTETWPQVGDEVEHKLIHGQFKVVATNDNFVWVRDIEVAGDSYHSFRIEKLFKPKSPEEELRDELLVDVTKTLHGTSYVTLGSDLVVTSLMDKYNITRKDK